jgi:hypothetical protein
MYHLSLIHTFLNLGQNVIYKIDIGQRLKYDIYILTLLKHR